MPKGTTIAAHACDRAHHVGGRSGKKTFVRRYRRFDAVTLRARRCQGRASTLGRSTKHASPHTTTNSFDRTTDFGPSNLSLPYGKCRFNDAAIQIDCTAHSVLYDVASNTFRPLMILLVGALLAPLILMEKSKLAVMVKVNVLSVHSPHVMTILVIGLRR